MGFGSGHKRAIIEGCLLTDLGRNASPEHLKGLGVIARSALSRANPRPLLLPRSFISSCFHPNMTNNVD